MPSNLQFYSQMADHTAKQITGSHLEWTAFLTTAARLYKYPYNEQLMIYAQRPNATACAEFDFWNDKMRRYVRRGSKGIALIDATGDRPKIRYVFDVSDTGTRDNSRSVNLWELQPEHTDAVTAMLERKYDVSGTDSLPDKLKRVAAQLADEYWNEHQRDIFDIVEDSFLEEYDDFNIGVQFRNAATVSITYALMSRCGMEPQDYFEHEDFLSIFDFNTSQTVAALGTAVSEINEQVLRQIEVTVKQYERAKSAERTAEHGEQPNLHTERRLPDTRPEHERTAGDAAGQIRTNEENVFEGASPDIMESPAVIGEAVPASAGDRRDSEPPLGADDTGADGSERSDGELESDRPDEVDGTDEQFESAGRGNNLDGVDLQLNLFEAPAPGEQLTLFSSEAEQIEYIDRVEDVPDTPFTWSFSQSDIDHALRLGGNNDNSRQRVAAEYMAQKQTEEIAAFLSREYVGGHGFATDTGKFAAWYAEDGIHLAHGQAAQNVKLAQVIPWERAAERIGELLTQGQFATNVELAETNGYIRSQLAQSLWYLRGDISEEARERNYLASMEPLYHGGYPTMTAALADRLADPDFRSALTDELTRFVDDYSTNRDILRFRYHRPSELLDRLHDLSQPWREYATDMAELPSIGHFITEDEIDAALTRGSSVEGGKGRIYAYFTEKHTPQEQASFMRNEYGIGGGNSALPGSFHSYKEYSNKGLRIKKPECADIELSWNTVVKRVADIIRHDRYFTPQEKAQYAELQRVKNTQTAAVTSYADYEAVKQAHPDDIVLYQVGDFFELYGEDARTARETLGLMLTSRNIGYERVPMCGLPQHKLEEYTDKLHDKYDVTISGIEQISGERRVFSLPSVDREAERDIDAHEAEYGADGLRMFPDNAPEQEEAPTMPPHTEITQDDIDDALRSWNGDTESKQRVNAYMTDHAHDKDTAAWLSREYGGKETKSLLVTVTGTDLETELSWAKVQRRIAQLIREDSFFTDRELADIEQTETVVPTNERFTVVETDTGYAVWDDLRNGYYEDDIGVTEYFTNEWQAEDYLEQVRLAVSEREAVDWQSVKQDNLSDLSMEVAEYEAERAAYREQIISTLTPEQQRIVEAMEVGGFPFRPTEQNPIYFGDYSDYPTVFDTWADAYVFIDGAELKDTPGLRDKVQATLHPEPPFPYAVGDTVYLEDGKPFIFTEITDTSVQLQDPTLFYPIFRAESRESFERLMERYPQTQPEAPAIIQPPSENFRISDDNLGVGGAKTKFHMNMEAIYLLKKLELDGRQATPDEQETLSKYVGWGGLADAFDETKSTWSGEFQELYAVLSPEEYAAARASTLNAHYTSPTVIRAVYEAVGNMGFTSGNVLEPSMGVGNFFGLLPLEMSASKLYGVELDSITGRIAKQLYPNANITVAGFETTDRRDFFDLAVGNVPFGNYNVADKPYDKLGFNIHNYFFAKALDQVRPGGVIAFLTSRYTMDAKDSSARKYIAQRADLLGAIRLPNNAFKANAGTEVTADIIFLQKRDRPIDIAPDWVHLGETNDGITVNSYFTEHPEMVLGTLKLDDMMYGDKKDVTCEPFPDANLADLLHDAIQNIGGTYREAEMPELGEGETVDTSIPADPNAKNYSYTVVDGDVYYRENSRMVKPELNATATERVKGMVELRDCVQRLIEQQMDGYIPDTAIRQTQAELNDLYDNFTAKYGLLNSRGNALAFADDNSYYLLCSLEVLDEDNNLSRKADMFTKRTIKPHQAVESVNTASEALALSISEKAKVDLPYMAQLTGFTEEKLVSDLQGVIFRDFGELVPEQIPKAFFDPNRFGYVAADEYLSGNVREKLRLVEYIAGFLPEEESRNLTPNIEALRAAHPKDLDASEIEVRLGATWIDKEYIQQFMYETFNPAYYLRRSIEVNYSNFSAEWNVTGKTQVSYNDVNAYMTYGTTRANAYRILEDTLNLRDVRIYDTVQDPDGKERRVLNSKETTLAQQKQQAIKDAFKDWIWHDPERRQQLVAKYNEIFNSCRPREYDGRHITFSGMNPEISLREHQLNAVAHVLYGGNTLLAHEVGAGKTFEMVAAAMESKRLGLCQKSLFAVPNHLTEQWASEFLRLYPSANILVATKKDFETRNRKKFCARIATGDYDAVILGHSQFERIPMLRERQERLLQEQIDEIEEGLEELKASRAERFTVKQLERTKKSLEARLEKLTASDRKDDVVTFEQLGVDRLYVDEAHNYKNCFLYTKMRNVAGLSTTDAQKSSDMLLKCRYIDEITGNRGVVFATGTPVSNSMTELYTMMRYLQHNTIQKNGLAHFDCWASTFGETTTAIELAPEGTGYRARTRFAKFFNLPELMTLFKEVADIKTSDQLNLPTPTPVYHNIVAQPTELQKEMVKELSERAAEVHTGKVDPTFDNMLRITSDGRKLGLDQRVINPDLPDAPTSKVNMCVDNITRIWQEGQADKLTQLVFCDISTPKTTSAKRAAKAVPGNLDNPELHALESALELDGSTDSDRFTIYDDIRQKLVERGIPAEQIAFIHDANTEVRKKELYARVRSGNVRVLLGSTFKMGSGMNVQDRLVALHDLDCPWRPGDLEQRSGRIIRQGNKNKEVHIFRYVTEGTFDSYLWQTVENKQKFISQIMTSKSPVRSCDDIDATALSYAEIKALCAGDDRIREKMDLDVDVARLKIIKSNHQSQQYRLEDNLLKYFPEQIEKTKGFIAGFETDMATLAAHQHPKDGFAGMEVKGDKLIDKDNAGAALIESMKDAKGLEPVPIGNYRGFAMSLTVEDFGRDFVLTLKGQMTHRVELGKDARGNLVRIDNTLAQMPQRLETAKSQLENLYTQVEAAKAEVGKPFPQEDELKTKSARLAALNAALNIDERTPIERMAEPETAKRERPSVLQKLRQPTMPTTPPKTKTKEKEL